MRISRRQLLLGTALGTGAVGLKSLVTGLPRSFLLDPSVAEAQAAAEPAAPQYLILSTSQLGDPFNVNAPGAYVTGAQNNPWPALAPVNVMLGGRAVRAARPWSTVPADLLAR